MAPHSKKRTRTSSSYRVRPRLLTFESRVAPAVFTVLNNNDAGAGSLRAALTSANATAVADTIDFDATFFSTPRTITLATVLPTISQDVSIVGPGASNLTITANNVAGNRDFLVSIDGKIGNVSLSGMTLSGGRAPADQIGGAIFTDEALTITNCVISGNTAAAGAGVGTATYGLLTIRNSTISGNTASGVLSTPIGGGVFIGQFGSLKISDSTIAGNSAAIGGGIALQANNTLLMERCTVSGNTASGTVG